MKEEALAKAAGLDLERLRQIRKNRLYLDDDYSRKHGGAVVYTPAGVAKIMAIAEEKTVVVEERKPDAEQRTSEASDTVDMRIIRPYPNPTWVKCVAPNGQRVDVRVQNNRHLHAFQTLKGCWKGADSRWVYPGRCVI